MLAGLFSKACATAPRAVHGSGRPPPDHRLGSPSNSV